MISADIPITMNSTADLSLKINDFIEYSLKNDLNIVTTKWLAHTRKITITEARNALQTYWDTIGKGKGYCATFSVFTSSPEGFSLELIDHDQLSKLSNTTLTVLSTEIYAVHAVPLKDKSVQLGMINVPIYNLEGEIRAPWIDTDNFPQLQPVEDVKMKVVVADTSKMEVSDDDELMEAPESHLPPSTKPPSTIHDDAPVQEPPGKKMKMVKKIRTFMENGYQMTEVVNELVPCEEGDDDVVEQPAVKPLSTPTPAVKAKQSSMMSFFKKK